MTTTPTKPTSVLSLADLAQKLIPGGVNSPVRAMRAVEGGPLFAARSQGSALWDSEGKQYIDYISSWGPAILGHADPATVEAIQQAATRGLSFGVATEAEVEFAQLLVASVPSLEQVRLVNSGTEACMSAVRLARGFTSRDRIVKVVGGYHGHADCLLVPRRIGR